MEGLEYLRELIGKPIIITSACRCEKHNRRVGGAQPDPKKKKFGSQHLYGTAADIRVPGMTVEQLARAAEQVRAFRTGGIGRYPRKGFVHVDVRGYRARWTM